ncbi:MAG: CDP-diacylglycerol--glycerol-3-phosphate 3-phosphatidyltransferase [Parcubacteria group bacterium Gr01-1014_72]|nr:MAG: CDP-diacylglycerol--glycerol-3-phosphate 3-phosphatidyltransferase [Parcubacteria group bacterium Gr01-1014_72]
MVHDPTKVTVVDRLLAVTILPLLPRFVTPNHITWFRFGTIPFVIYLFAIGEYEIAAPLFLISAFSDALDGALARTQGLVSDWGKFYDPLADKLLIGSTAAILVGRAFHPFLALSIITLEVLLMYGAYRRNQRGEDVSAKHVGKIKMVLQSAGLLFLICFLIFDLPWLLAASFWTLVLSLVFAVLSLVVYRSI